MGLWSALTRYVRAVSILTTLLAIAILAAPATVSARRHRAPAAPSNSEEGAETAGSALTAPYIAACVMEPTTGTVIFEADAHKPWPTASLTKMMLMLIVAEKLHDGSLKLSDQITTSRKAAKMGGSQVYLAEGETFALEDMMQAIVVHSANDASVAVAEYIAGSTEAFVQMMNKRAAGLGMKDTHYSSVHGLPPGPGQQADVSSAYDSAVLARELVKYPDILRWSAIDTTRFRRGTFELRNTNHLVRTFRGCDGLKTGFYYKAGFNVTATAQRNDLRLIAVVLGSPRKAQNFGQAATMLSQGFLNYQMYRVARKGDRVAQKVAVTGGAATEIKPAWDRDVAVFLKRGDEHRALKINFNLPGSIAAPVTAGDQIGSAEVLVDGKPAATAPLVAPDNIPRASLLRRLFGI